MSLKPYREPPPKPRRACEACKTFAPECLVPMGDAAVPMCWLCAHHVVEHDVPLTEAFRAECECGPHLIYPDRVLAVPPPDESAPAPTAREADRDRLLDSSLEKIKAWVREAHKQLSLAQHAAVKRRLN